MNTEFKILSTYQDFSGRKYAIIEINGLTFLSWLSGKKGMWLVSPFLLIGKFDVPWIAKRSEKVPRLPARIVKELGEKQFPKKDGVSEIYELAKFKLVRGDGTILLSDFPGMNYLGSYLGPNRHQEIYDFYKKFNEIKRKMLSIRERIYERKKTSVMRKRFIRNKALKEKLKVKKRTQRRI